LYCAADEDNGGFLAETAVAPDFGFINIERPNLPFETLASPVIAEDMKEEFDDTLKQSLFDAAEKLGFVKSRVNDCNGVVCVWTKFTGVTTAGDEITGVGAGDSV
jgi:hypothetical protein